MSPSQRDWRLYADDIIESCGKVRGMRDVVAHGYFGVDTKVVWSTATTRLDDLERAVRRILP